MKSSKNNRSNDIPVSGAVLKWARESSGYSFAEVAQKLGRKRIDAHTIEMWENDQAFPSYSQLEALAYGIYRRPLAIFFFPNPPEEDTPDRSFRTLPQNVIRDLSPRIRLLIRRAQVMQMSLKELYDNANPASRHIIHDIRPSVTSTVTDLAQQARVYLGATLETQSHWQDPDRAFNEWRDILLRNGIFVFLDAFREAGATYSGFCLFDDTFPIIYVNNSAPPTRRIFTLFHETAHLLFRTGGIDTRLNEYIESLRGDAKKIEIICNRFAGAFLVPDTDFDTRIRGFKSEKSVLSGVEKLANIYSVSREVILRKCLDRGIVSANSYNEVVSRWQEERERLERQRKKKRKGGNIYNNQLVYLGRPYIETAFSQYRSKRISFSQLAEYLGVKYRGIPELEARLYRSGVKA